MTEANLKTKSKASTKRPRRYTAVFINDDYTPMEFVIDIMIKYFDQSPEDALKVTLDIHNSGRGNAGIFTREVAETKVMQAMNEARKHQHPFECTVEPA